MTHSETLPTPLVSVVIPVKNGEETIGDTLLSVLEQDFSRPFEIIVVNDGSTDATLVEVHLHTLYNKNVPVRVINHPKCRGVNAARNTGIKAARGKFVALIDADDLWAPEKLERQFNAIVNLGEKKQKKTFCLTSFRFFIYEGAYAYLDSLADQTIDTHTGTRQFNPKTFSPGQAKINIISGENWFATGSTIFARRETFLNAGLYDERLKCREETEILYRHILNDGDIIVVNEFLTDYRMPSDDKKYPLGRDGLNILLGYSKRIKEKFGKSIANKYRAHIRIIGITRDNEKHSWLHVAAELTKSYFLDSDVTTTSMRIVVGKKAKGFLDRNERHFAHFYPF